MVLCLLVQILIKSRTVLRMRVMNKVTVFLSVFVLDFMRMVMDMTRCTMSKMVTMIMMTCVASMAMLGTMMMHIGVVIVV